MKADVIKNGEPKSLKDCIQLLDEAFEGSDYQLIEECGSPKDFRTKTHHGFGRFIRNEWELWAGSKLAEWFNKELDVYHADDMSSLILTGFYRWYKDEEFYIDSHIKRFHDHWGKEEMERQRREMTAEKMRENNG